MGELSKKIGEYGEEVAKELLADIGWTQLQKGIELPNLFVDLYPKKTYGIDYLMSYECPLTDNTVKNILVSVKYHKDKYPDDFKSKAKSHLIELSEMLQSFSYSEEKSAANDQLGGSIIEDIGVLIWLCHKDSTIDIRQELLSMRIDLPFERTKIVIVDNIQADFLFSSIGFIKSVFSLSTFEFYYPNTGQNINPITKTNSGTLLPLEFISSPILVFKVTEGKTITLSLTSSEPFNKSNLRRIIGLMQDISTDLSNQILLAFPDYDDLEHSNLAIAVKNEFSNKGFVNKIQIANFSNNRFKMK